MRGDIPLFRNTEEAEHFGATLSRPEDFRTLVRTYFTTLTAIAVVPDGATERKMMLAVRSQLLREAIQAHLAISNTEPRRDDPSPLAVASAEASEGPERAGHKPLMRNPSAENPAAPIGHTSGDTFTGGGLA